MKYLTSIFILLLFFGCSQEQESIESQNEANEGLTSAIEKPDTEIRNEGSTIISGKISNPKNIPLSINFIGPAGMQNMGAIDVDSSGNFNHELTIDDIGFYSLAYNAENSILLFIEPGSSTVITADGNQLFDSYSLTESTKDSKLIKEYFEEYNRFAKEQQDLNLQMSALDYSADDARTELIAKSEAIRAEFNQYKRSFIDANEEMPMLAFLLDHLNPKTELDYIKKIGESAKKSLFGTHYNDMVQRVVQARIQSQNPPPTPSGQIAVGQMAPEIAFPNPNGEIIKLSSLRGKLVLLDFWASWCRPCRMENPNVVRMYNKYKDKGFDIYSFSLDQDPARWKNAIQQDGLVWPNHASDLKGWNTATIPLYGFKGIPFTVLIDKDGKILETNLRGPALENKLKSLLG
ncbi:MAG TPA: hypothetical protein DCF89_00695 [Flavobacteriales bacterium]|nr:hypothetical protein [Crocinitomicaceae bacterium]HAE29601.1 hypothetical protein [Flavobacteriales bacterium]|tara:strand:+ start:175 stop:1389 length:1215 start_codon:yes stop_codon:yes gene_type:complete